MKRTALLSTVVTLALAGCAPGDADSVTGAPAGQEEFLSSHGLTGMGAEAIIDHLDRVTLTQRPTGLMASVLPDELVLSDSAREIALELPADRSYISVAPYLTRTHNCFHHSLTTCVGELDNENIHVTITDEETGAVLVDEQATTYDNGFIGYWLPRDTSGLIEITSPAGSGSTEFSTAPDGATCLTELQLT